MKQSVSGVVRAIRAVHSQIAALYVKPENVTIIPDSCQKHKEILGVVGADS